MFHLNFARHTHTHFCKIFTLYGLAALVMVMLPNRSAVAQTPRFRVTRITELGFIPNIDTHGPMGIAGKGEVVFGYTVSGQVHAFVWLPQAKYGQTAGLHDLNTISSGTEAIPNIAHDINQNGVIAGQSGALGPNNPGLGTLWRLGATGVPFHILGTFDGSPAWSNAFALSEDTNPIVVGDSNAYRQCQCGPTGGNRDVTRAFKVTYPLGPPPALTELLPGSNDTVSYARDVNTVQHYVVGGATCAGSSEQTICEDLAVCFSNSDAVRWNIGTRETFVDLSAGGSQTRGANNSDEYCGWGFTTGSLPDCKVHAVLCVGLTAVVDLGIVGGEGADQSWAEGINTHGTTVQIVGWNDTQGLARLWEKQASGVFTVLNLDSDDAIGPTANALYNLRRAYDINDDTWIVVWATTTAINPPIRQYAFLLTPYVVAGNANSDASVNQADLASVMSSFGSCPDGLICWADVNNDGEVNWQDLRIVMQNYGAPGQNGSGLGPELLNIWHAAGGESAIASGQIHASNIANALNAPNPAARFSALAALVAQ